MQVGADSPFSQNSMLCYQVPIGLNQYDQSGKFYTTYCIEKKKKRKTNQLLQKDPSQQVIQSPSNRKYREPLNSLRDSSHYPHQENPARSWVQI